MDYYSKISNRYNELYGEEQLNKVRIIIKKLKIKEESVLDVGCGTAFYSKLFTNYIGIDKSRGMLKNSIAKVFYGYAEKLPFKDKSFDIVICITAIHNFKDPENAIIEIKRVSKGKIAISLLKRSSKFNEISKIVNKYLEVYQIDEEKDVIFIQDS